MKIIKKSNILNMKVIKKIKKNNQKIKKNNEKTYSTISI